ncbi:MAG: penicillin-binding protein [Patescibacteria group bacterium]
MPIKQLKKSHSDAWSEYKNARGIKAGSRKEKGRLLKRIFLAGILICLSLAVLGSIYAFWISRDLPNPNQLINREIAQSTKIYDRTGEHILYEISGDQKRTLIDLKDIPNQVKQATIAIEDKNFYNHGAFSVWAMFRTVITNLIFSRNAGGSTLTQQFIKNAVLSPEKTIARKIKELILSYRLEKKFSKDEILQMYLNEIPYGSNAYGIEAASQKYFGKSITNVSLAEAAILAAIVQTPSRYSPYGPNKDILLARKDYVLDLMVEQKYISTTERDLAKQQEIKFKGPETNIIAPHFIMYIKDLLSEKYGEKTIEQGGLKIYTTLDLDKQKIAEEVIATRTKNYSEKYGANNAALIAIDPKTGQILSMVGSRDYFDDSIDGQVNVSTRPRQPGSSMKPIVYAALFEKGYTPDTILYDVVTNFSTDQKQKYEPHNYNNKEYGPVSIRQALAGSLNIPAVKAIYLAGINSVIDLAENLGYSTLYPRSRFGLSLVLGGAEVKLLEHVNAYSVFANDGQVNQVTGLLKIEDKNGRIIEEYTPSARKALDSKVVKMINSILSDNNARTYIFGAKNFLTLNNRPVGAKTGTTNDYHDAWTIGYTPSLVAGVWVGNSNNQAMKGKADGSVLAAPIWHDFMAQALDKSPVENFPAPDDYKTGKDILDGRLSSETVSVNKETGFVADSSTPPELIEERAVPAYHSILYYVDKDNPLGSAPLDPNIDPQFNLWEKVIKSWAEKNASSSLISSSSDEALHRPENLPKIVIISPLKNQIINISELTVQVTASSTRGITRIDYYINSNLWETKYANQENFTKNISFLNNGYHSLKANACDDVENCTVANADFNVLIKNNPISASTNSLKISLPAGETKFKKDGSLINIALQVKIPERVVKIKIMARALTTSKLVTLGGFDNIDNKNINISLNNILPTGSWYLYSELADWNGTIIKSNELKILVE